MLSVIIPIRNERDTILQVIDGVRAVDVGMPKEIIVVDGASTDGTRERLQTAQGEDLTIILEEVAQGKGVAVRTALAQAAGDIVVIQDADLELDPAELPNLLQPIVKGEVDAVFGVRFAHGRGATPWPSYVGNRAFSLLVSVLFRHRLNDVLTAYKMMRKEIATGLALTCLGFDLDAEIACRLLRAGHRIAQVPVAYRPRGRAEGKKLGMAAAWSILKAILRVRCERRGATTSASAESGDAGAAQATPPTAGGGSDR